MVGKIKVLSLLLKHMEDLGINNNITKLQCLIHQEALCTKISSLKSVMNIVVKVVNFILSQGLNYPQFRQLLLQTENLNEDLLYFYDVCWLSRGDMLQRANVLREEKATFLKINRYMLPNFAIKNGLLIWHF